MIGYVAKDPRLERGEYVLCVSYQAYLYILKIFFTNCISDFIIHDLGVF